MTIMQCKNYEKFSKTPHSPALKSLINKKSSPDESELLFLLSIELYAYFFSGTGRSGLTA